jgi:predicted TIM-barrel fold metal-dependent hydrolase
MFYFAGMATLAYRMVDADNHFYEPDDCFTRHIEAGLRERTVRVERERPDAIGRMFVGQTRLGFFSVAVGDHVGPPGMMRAFLRGEAESGAVNASPIDARKVPAFVDKKARVALLDEQGVEACIMLPTLGVGVEYTLRREPELLYPSLAAYNRFLEEDWGFGGDGRIFAPALLSLAEVDRAIVELERVLAAGARLVLLTAGPVGGRSPADPHFDRFWARLAEASVPFIYHVGGSEFARLYAAPWGESPDPPSHRHSALQMYLALGPRPVADSIAALILHNLFGRFPGLFALSIENGSSWVAPLLRQLDELARMDNKDMWRFGRLDAKPSEIFRRHVFVAPFHEDDVPGLVELIGGGHVLAGSDFPHPEGLARPLEFLESLEGLPADVVRAIMRDNTARLLGLS